MKQLLLLLLICALLGGCQQTPEPHEPWASEIPLGQLKLDSTILAVSLVAEGLEVPWELTMDPEGYLWFTEHKGTVNRLNANSLEREVLLQIPDIHHVKSRGLLGMVLHPKFSDTAHVFLHYTFAIPEQHNLETVMSKLVRYTFQKDTLVEPVIIMDSIPGNTYHNGSRLVITPDHKLFFSMGDVGRTDLAQDIGFKGGKILRLNLDGSIPVDNPFAGNPVWSWGHRNSQGMVYAENGHMYTTDHGPLNDDEVNLITKGGNYGWPDVQGAPDLASELAYVRDSLIVPPLKFWTPTIGIAGLDYYNHPTVPEWKNTLLAVSMKGQSLQVMNLSTSGSAIEAAQVFLFKRFGRLRDLCVAKNGDIFLGTSNNDWHPRLQPWLYDSLPDVADRIIRLHPLTWEESQELLTTKALLWQEDTIITGINSENWNFQMAEGSLDIGEKLYLQHCASCHQTDGRGAPGLIPPLAQTDWVVGDKTRLIRVLLNGLSGPITVNDVVYQEEMPAYQHLQDQELAHISTYIRKSFGNEAGVVIPGEIYEERKVVGR